MTGRIGTVTGHKNLSTMIGFAGQEQYLLDPVAKTMTLLNWRGASTATRTAYAMSGDGDYFVQLDNSGKLIVQDVGAGYSTKGSLQLINKIDTANPPVISANLQNDDIFITDSSQSTIAKSRSGHDDQQHFKTRLHPSQNELGWHRQTGEITLHCWLHRRSAHVFITPRSWEMILAPVRRCFFYLQ